MSFTHLSRRPRGDHGWLISSSEALDWVRAVIAEEPDGLCRDWPGCTGDKGYGQMGYEGRTRQVGHVVLELSGRLRPSLAHQQMHSCDRPCCAAPWHLRWGTNDENRAESVDRDRHSRGERAPNAKLTDAAVIEIRTSGAPLTELAEKFGIHFTTAWKARVGETWKHVQVAA